MCQPTATADVRRHQRRSTVFISLSLIGYLLFSQGSLYLKDTPLGLTLSALAGLCFFAELVATGLLLYRRFDEFQRVLLLHSFLWATVVTMGLTIVCGFVELHLHNPPSHPPLLAVPFCLIVTTALIKVLIFRQHRSTGD